MYSLLISGKGLLDYNPNSPLRKQKELTLAPNGNKLDVRDSVSKVQQMVNASAHNAVMRPGEQIKIKP